MKRCNSNKLTRQQMQAIIRNAHIARSCRCFRRDGDLNLYTYESKCEGDDLILILSQLNELDPDCPHHHDDDLDDGHDLDFGKEEDTNVFPGIGPIIRPRNELTLEFEFRCGSRLLVVYAESKIELPCRGGRDASYLIVRIRPCDLTGYSYNLNDCFDCC